MFKLKPFLVMSVKVMSPAFPIFDISHLLKIVLKNTNLQLDFDSTKH